ncbi:hypothetical protein AB0F13_15840 [Streptomyces sp. NPDC026206]|uniref:hypothetical protein n=1 Tax=Streptomyces sp. NPDC026206 TaxID=3157089 RepID=UPI0033CC30F8
MGWTVLYIAFGVVALWLLGEVLLQYKARLRWRLLAFVGFLGVVAGVVIPSVAVIVVGAVAFAVGQSFVTLSFRRGFSRGWALRRTDETEAVAPRSRAAGRSSGKAGAAAGRSSGKAGAGRRRKAERPASPPPPPVPDTTLPASGPDAVPAVPAADSGIPDLVPNVPQQPTAEHPPAAGYDTSGYATGPYETYGGGQSTQTAGAPAQGGYAGQFDYGQGQQYASYSDPYIGNRPPSYEQYDGYGQQQPYPQQQYGAGTYPAEAYAPPQYDIDTPPGGVWVPQQRDDELPAMPDAQPEAQPGQQPPYPPQQLPGYSYDEQGYRY